MKMATTKTSLHLISTRKLDLDSDEHASREREKPQHSTTVHNDDAHKTKARRQQQHTHNTQARGQRQQHQPHVEHENNTQRKPAAKAATQKHAHSDRNQTTTTNETSRRKQRPLPAEVGMPVTGRQNIAPGNFLAAPSPVSDSTRAGTSQLVLVSCTLLIFICQTVRFWPSFEHRAAESRCTTNPFCGSGPT